MLAFLLRRVIQATAVLAVVGLIAFSMFRFAGDPVNQIVGPDTPASERAEIRKSLGLDDPVLLQFARYAGDVVQGRHLRLHRFRRHPAGALPRRALTAPETGLAHFGSEKRP